MKRYLRASAVALAWSSLVVSMPGVQAANYQIEGEGVPVAICGGQGSDFTMQMTGSLVGCWYSSIEDVTIGPSGAYHESGTETFVGCLVVDGRTEGCGTFETVYDFHAKFTPEFVEIHGRCQHMIVSGSGIFADGRVDFKDDIAAGRFFYRGHVDVD